MSTKTIMALSRFSFPLLFWALLATAAGMATSFAAGPEPGGPADLEHCRAIADDAARLRCYESATSPGLATAAGTSNLRGGWRLVRTRNPRGGEDAVSVMHTADLIRSDPDFAGLTLRCGEAELEVLVILLQTLSPRAKPQVVITGAGTSTKLSATVVSPGTIVLLPPQATSLASGTWQKLNELAFEVEGEGSVVRGVVPLEGLNDAVQTLRINCPSR